MMLYRVLLSLIQKGLTEGLEEKIDIFFAAGKLTGDQYSELIQLLEQEESANAN